MAHDDYAALMRHGDLGSFLDAVLRPPAWMDRAACAGLPLGLFFPERGKGTTAEARAVCARCPVCAECLAYAMADDDCRAFGVWGNTTAAARRKMGKADAA